MIAVRGRGPRKGSAWYLGYVCMHTWAWQEAVHIYLLNKDLYITQEKERGFSKCPYGLERAWGWGDRKQSHRLEHWRAMATEKYFRRFLSIPAHSRWSYQYHLLLMHICYDELCFYEWHIHISDICLEILLILYSCPDTKGIVMQFLGVPEVLTNWQTDTEQWDYMSLKSVFIWSLKVLPWTFSIVKYSKRTAKNRVIWPTPTFHKC